MNSITKYTSWRGWRSLDHVDGKRRPLSGASPTPTLTTVMTMNTRTLDLDRESDARPVQGEDQGEWL